MPSWAEPLLGTYAMRARFFARGGALGAINPLTNQWTMLGKIRWDADKAEVLLTAKLCEATGQNDLAGFIADAAPVYPRRLPDRTFPVRSDGQQWWTEAEPLAYGFDFEPLVDCTDKAGQRVRSAASQSWLSDGFCTCPTDLTMLPVSQSDCRINDVDHDSKPGVTVAVTGALDASYCVRLLDNAQLHNGKFDRAQRQHSANYAQSQDLQQIVCPTEPCGKDFAIACDEALDPVLFMPLADDASCDDVISQRDALFGSSPLTFPPTGC
jgi:hypothetical protein